MERKKCVDYQRVTFPLAPQGRLWRRVKPRTSERGEPLNDNLVISP